MSKNNQYFNVYSCIKIVKGFKLGMLYDLQRKEYVQLPLDLCEVLISQNHNPLSIKELENDKFNSCVEQFRCFVTWLAKHDFILFCNSKSEAELFREISTKWSDIDLLINAIIDIDNNSKYDVRKAITNLQIINCHSIQFRFFCDYEIESLLKIIRFTKDKSFQNIELILPYQEMFSKILLQEFAQEFANLVSITFFNSPRNNHIIIDQISISYTTQKVVSEKDCGNICKTKFACDLNYFKESLHRNICLNGKVAIDKNGKIKNCPSFTFDYGDINEVDIQNVISKNEFKQYWFIKKDIIEVCKHCEFRYMCADCRAYTKVSNNLSSQPLKCTYNPFIAKWKGEEGYIPVENCGAYSKEKGFVVDKLKVDAINIELDDF